MANCTMCQDHRWIRIRGSAARVWSGGKYDELQAVCPVCNTKGEHSEEPGDWERVPIVKGTAVEAGRG